MIINWNVRWPNVTINEILTAQKLDCVMNAMCWCIGALSCWKTSTYAAMLQITSSSSCISNISVMMLLILAPGSIKEVDIIEFRHCNNDLTDLLTSGMYAQKTAGTTYSDVWLPLARISYHFVRFQEPQ